MPRIRTLKPEHKGHRKVGPLSDRAYRLWVGLITEADDLGRLVCDVRHFRSVIFSYQALAPAKVQAALDAILETGLLRRYEVEGVTYLYFPSWREHQKIDKPRPSTLPAPPDDSTSVRRRFDDASSSIRPHTDPTDPKDRILPIRPTDRIPPEGLSASRVGGENGRPVRVGELIEHPVTELEEAHNRKLREGRQVQ